VERIIFINSGIFVKGSFFSRRCNMVHRRKSSFLLNTAALTDPGKIRKNNEDSLWALDKKQANVLGADSYGIYLVADGMGGHRGGEVASAMAVRIISGFLMQNLKKISSSPSPLYFIKRAIDEANAEISALASRKAELYSMGTTVTLGFRLDNELYLGQVGDSRAYLIRNGRIQQLTRDHSLVAHLVSEGAITAEEARFHPDRGKILRCLGVAGNVTADTFSLTLLGGDALVFCSDGLTSNVSDQEILRHIIQTDDAGEACVRLVALTNSRGGEDNTSIIVVRVKPELGCPE
jgi:serine/threonine protein phosphatase PrpC